MPEATSPAQQLAGFLAKFDPPIARLIRSCRAVVRKRLPTAIELVYDNYNFFVIGYCSTPRASDCVVSLAANAKGIGLSFYYGATRAALAQAETPMPATGRGPTVIKSISAKQRPRR